MFLTFLVTRHYASKKKQLFSKRYHHLVVNRRSETKNTRIARIVWPVIQQAARRYELLEASNILITCCIAYDTRGLKRLFERHNFLHLTCPLRLPGNTAKSQSTSNSKETGLKMYTQHNSHGTFMPLQKKKCTSYYGCLWCCC
jgi:hypothetical protein